MKEIIVLLVSFFLAGALSAKTLVVGAKTFTEQKILGEITCLLLEKEGHVCKRVFNVSTKPLSELFLQKKVDVYWEYDGTISAFLGLQSNDEVNKKLEEMGIKRGALARFSNPFVLASLNPEWKKISDLSRVPISMIMIEAFRNRPDSFDNLAKLYDLKVPTIGIMSHFHLHRAVLAGEFQVAVLYGTDPQIPDENFIVMEDDRRYFLDYIPAPLYHVENAEIFRFLDEVGPLLTHEAMVELNRQVDYGKQTHRNVAEQWLKKNSLL